MNTKQLPYAIAIAETGSLSKASKRLGISQPTLSKYLSALESETGLRIFVREKNRMIPTEAGAVYIDAARRILDVQTQTHNAIANLFHSDRQRLRIGVTPHRGAQLLATSQPHLLKQFPEYDIEAVEGYAQSLKDMTRSGQLDIAFITMFAQEPNTLHHLRLFAEEVVLSVPAFHKLAVMGSRDAERARRINIDKLQDSPFVSAGEQTSVGQIFERAAKQAGFEPMTVFRSNNILAVVEMIRTGAGVGIIPLHYAIPSDDVVYFRLEEPAFLYNCVAVHAVRRFTRIERYLIYLNMLLYVNRDIPGEKVTWSEELRDIMLEFDPHYYTRLQEARS